MSQSSAQALEGVSPEWPIEYRDWEPYYTQAEELYEVHRKAGEDPTEHWRSKEYPHQMGRRIKA